MSARKKYHQSEINTYLKCGKMWEFRYVKGIKNPPRGAMILGSSVDRAVSLSLVAKKHGGEISEQEAMAIAADTIEELAVDAVFDEDAPKDEIKDHAVALSSLHHRLVLPNIQPVTIQEEFIIELDGGYDVGGTLDVVDDKEIIRDTKAVARTSVGRYDSFRAMQPAMYDFAYEAIRGKKAAGFAYDLLKRPTKKIAPEYEERKSVITLDDREWLFDAIDATHKGVQAGVAVPAPEGSWYCSEKWCGYWNICKGKKR